MQYTTKKVLAAIMSEPVSLKAASENESVITHIESQLAKFGEEKHVKFLARVFHGRRVSNDHFYKVMQIVIKASAKKAGVQKAKASTKAEPKAKKATTKVVKAEKVEKKAEPKAPKASTSTKKASATKAKASTKASSEPSLTTLKSEIAKLVKSYNAQTEKKVVVMLSHTLAEIA